MAQPFAEIAIIVPTEVRQEDADASSFNPLREKESQSIFNYLHRYFHA